MFNHSLMDKTDMNVNGRTVGASPSFSNAAAPFRCAARRASRCFLSHIFVTP